MTKKSGLFDVSLKTNLLKPTEVVSKGMAIEKALSIISRQMELNG
ncbi:hypothetical protein [Amphibacillus jilinensis]|nr:hypothetical protein [Amphibacillus jilinensis]